jgi:DNA-binding NtrC family response regulator
VSSAELAVGRARQRPLSREDGKNLMGKPSHRASILAVDDEVEFHELIQAIFSRTHNVRGVTSVEAALRVLQQSPIDVVLLDVRLPGRAGWDLLRILARKPDSPPVIVVTADACNQVRVQAERLGAAHTFFKPVTPQQLREAVKHCEYVEE